MTLRERLEQLRKSFRAMARGFSPNSAKKALELEAAFEAYYLAGREDGFGIVVDQALSG